MGVLRSAAHTGGPSPGFGAFSSSPYTVPLCWVWGPGIAVLRSCHEEMCVTVFAFFTYLLTYCTRSLVERTKNGHADRFQS